MATRTRPSCRRVTTHPAWRRLAWSPRREVIRRHAPGLEFLKWAMLDRALRTFGEPHFQQPLRVAAEQAADLAQETGLPLLFFPELFEELAIAAMLRSEYLLNGRL
jgi:hypothetical protein